MKVELGESGPKNSHEFRIGDKTVVVKWEPCDMNKYGTSDERLLKWGVVCPPDPSKKIAVAEGAPYWYKSLSTLHELMCRRDLAQEISPELVESDEFTGDGHCRAIEGFIIDSVIGDDVDLRNRYINARIDMFKGIIEMYGENASPMFQRTLDYLIGLIL
jgi:hypothetical protein